MGIWTFQDYIDEDGSAPIDRWLAEIGGEARAAIDQRLLVQSAVPRWNDNWIKKLKTSDGIFELRISWNRREYRLLGCYQPDRRFVLLEGAVEKDSKLPRGSVERAEQRRRILLKEAYRVRRHSYRAK